MINDYECPRCHNVFPSSNKFSHDARCTEEKPVPLNASRMVISQPSENKEEIIPKKEENFININEINDPPMEEDFPTDFYCNICNVSMPENQKTDHMLCHDLERKEKKRIEKNINNANNFGISQREIEEQRKIERQIKRNNRQNQIDHNNNNHINNNNSNRNNNVNNNHIRPENVVQRTNEYNYNSSNNNNSHHRHNNGNNRVNRGPVIAIRQTGPNSHAINIFHNGIRSNQNRIDRNNNFHFEPLQIRRHGNFRFNYFNDFNHIFENVFSNVEHHHQHPTDKQILNELPETKIEDVSKLEQEKKNCVICLEDFKNGDKATILPCIHLFHKNCIKSWLKTQNCCPICKYKLTRSNMSSQNNNF